jgi:hypothetical protein
VAHYTAREYPVYETGLSRCAHWIAGFLIQ